MPDKFISATSDRAGDNWIICWTGQDREGQHHYVTTNEVRASELSQFSKGPQEDAALIARLLNWYYSDETAMKIIEERHNV